MQQRVFADRYRLIELIGAGGAAEVYRAEDLRLGRQVAVKVLRPQFVGDKEQRTRFQNEARAAAGLTHPNVVDVYDYGEANGTVFMVMQYVDGVNLLEYIGQRGKLYPVEAARIALAVCRGLEAAHQRGLVHRDVKPQNIMIDRGGLVRITDFGVAKALGAAKLTQAGMTYGTAAYLSPEQATGGEIGPTADIYALGLVLYEMLAGQPAFGGENASAVAYKQVYEQAPPLRSIAPDVPVQLEQIVNHAIAKQPQDRYPTAGAMAAALTEYLNFAPTPTPPHMIAVTSGNLKGRSADAAAFYGPPPLPGAGAGAAHTTAPAGVRADHYRAPQPVATAPDRRVFFLPALVGVLLLILFGGFMLSGALGGRSSDGADLATATAGLPVFLPTDTPEAATATLGGAEATNTTAPEVTATQQAAAPTDTTAPEAPTATAAPTDTPEPPTDTPEPPTNTPEPPTATSEPPTDTPEPPTNTPEPAPPTDTPLPSSNGRPVFPTPTVPVGDKRQVLLEDVAFTGGYRYMPPSIYPPNSDNGHTAVWVYGANTQFGTMLANFDIAGLTDGRGQVLISGVDSEGRAKTPMRIQINGVSIYEGEDPLANFPNWDTQTFNFDARILQPGRNTITIANLDPSDAIGQPPFIMVDYVAIAWQRER